MEEEKDIEYPYEFDDEKRKKAELYSKQKLYTGLFQSVFLYLLFLLISYFSGFSSYLEYQIGQLVTGTPLSNHWIIAAIFIAIYSILLYLISLPVSYYSGLILEHRYDLSNESIGEWAKDQVKSLLISMVIMVPIMLGLFYLGYTFPELWWLYAGIFLFVVSGILSNISHLVILPLFYDLHELKDEGLEKRLVEMAEENGVKELKKVMVVEAGEKTEKANAAFAGMSKTKRLLLFDTLLEKFHPEEIESVVAHEMGHYVNKDTIRLMLLSAVLIFPMFYITDIIFTKWASFANIYHLPLFLLIIYGLYSIVDPLTNAYSRSRERKADNFSIRTVGNPTAVVSTFKRLSDIDLAETDPHKLIEILFYDHPSPKKRIERAKSFFEEKERNLNRGKKEQKG